MPIRTDLSAGRYVAPACRFPMAPGQPGRDAASVAVDRLANAGLTYIQACAAVRELRVATARRGAVGEPKVVPSQPTASRRRDQRWWQSAARASTPSAG